MKREGVLYVVSAPSGAGKTSLCKELIDIFPNLRHSVSFTTRERRDGEVDGVDYHFVSIDRFQEMVRRDEFAEWAEVHGNLYGTSLRSLQEARDQGIDLILDIDCQGARQLKDRYEGGVFIFILPPNYGELRRRLTLRNTDHPEVIERRLSAAETEIRESRWYDYIVVNDSFEVALEEFRAIITAERCRTRRVLASIAPVFGI
ncbi:MAG: guanylate kinase [Desulfuromonadia bacterium]